MFAANLLGVLLGKTSSLNEELLDTVIGFLDDGVQETVVSELALNYVLGAGFSSDTLIKLLFQNLVGAEPTAEELTYYTELIGPENNMAPQFLVSLIRNQQVSDLLGTSTIPSEGRKYSSR